MPKDTKTGLALVDSIDLRKPLVKEFVDPDKAVDDFVMLNLPFVRQSIPYPKLVYTSKDQLTRRYRVNWFHEDGFISKSGYYELESKADGKMKFKEKQM